MKKLLPLLLVIVLVLNVSISAFADDTEELVLDDVGITFHLPEAFRNTAGTLIPDAGALGNEGGAPDDRGQDEGQGAQPGLTLPRHLFLSSSTAAAISGNRSPLPPFSNPFSLPMSGPA